MRSVVLRWRSAIVLTLACGAAACASAPPAAPQQPIALTFEQKSAAILRLEDTRMLRDVAPPLAPPPPVVRSGSSRVVAPPAPPPPPDLIAFLKDSEPRVRRRAALAVGRVALREGVQPLIAVLGDSDPEVRQMAAFALGLIADKQARDPLVTALSDPSMLVQGSAAEALGLIGDRAAAEPIGRMLAQIVQSGALASWPSEDEELKRDSPASVFRLGATALVRLEAYEPLAAAALDGSALPRVHGWPLAFALQRLEDRRALNALVALTKDNDRSTRAFAVKGLAALNDRAATPVLLPLLTGQDPMVLVEAIRALGRIGDPAAADPLLKIAESTTVDSRVRVEAVTALGGIHAAGVIDRLIDFLPAKDPAMRASALRSTAALDPEGFVTVLSGLDVDPDWHVRSTLATVLGTLPAAIALPRVEAMLTDADQRVIPAALAALAKLAGSSAVPTLLERLMAEDPAVRAAAAKALGELKPPDGMRALAAAYQFGQRDATYIARAAALEALRQYGADAAAPALQEALADKDWAVRVRAAELLKQLDPASDADVRIRPAPAQVAADVYQQPRLVAPAVSTQAFIDTDRGTIQIELAVLEAPLTVENFVTLARKGFFDGLTFHRVVPDFVVQGGDPRGDGEGGPGYTIRDEINERPYLRGTVGMALDWADTGGSQFFITHSPQAHLDAKYTVFGRVIAGMETVDRIEQGDVIRRVRIWDGQTAPAR